MQRTPRIGAIVAGSLITGFLTAVVLVALPFAGAEENVISGVVLLGFAFGWALLAALSARWTDQPQHWAAIPSGLMTIFGVGMLVWPGAVVQDWIGWLWPVVLLALVVWMVGRARRDLSSRTRRWILYPMFGVLGLAAVGGAYETGREMSVRSAFPMHGQLVDGTTAPVAVGARAYLAYRTARRSLRISTHCSIARTFEALTSWSVTRSVACTRSPSLRDIQSRLQASCCSHRLRIREEPQGRVVGGAWPGLRAERADRTRPRPCLCCRQATRGRWLRVGRARDVDGAVDPDPGAAAEHSLAARPHRAFIPTASARRPADGDGDEASRAAHCFHAAI